MPRSIICDGQPPQWFDHPVPEVTGYFHVDPGQEVVCRFTDWKLGTIAVHKETDPPDAPATFTFSGDVSGTIADGGTLTVVDVVPSAATDPSRIYTSTETLPEYWILTSIACIDSRVGNSWGDKPTATANFVVEPGEDVVCTFYDHTPAVNKDPRVTTGDAEQGSNLWLMKAGCVNPAEGKGCLEIDIHVYGIYDEDSPNDSDDLPEGLGAWEHQTRFDHKFVSLTPVPDNTWLQSGGRIANCTMMVLTENSILEGCVTKDDPNNLGRPGPSGPQATPPAPVHSPDGIIERIYVIPNLNEPDLPL